MEKRWILAAGVTSVLAIAFLAAFIATLLIPPAPHINNIPQTDELRMSASIPAVVVNGVPADVELCNTPECIHTASTLLLNMNDKVDPCDDFYDFACGSFQKHTRIPDDKPSVELVSIITDQLQEQLRALLEEPIIENEPKPFVLAKTLYQACMNQNAIESRGESPLLDMLRRLGGWPVLDGDSWDEKSFSWEKSVYNFRTIGYSVNYILKFDITDDQKNSNKNIIVLDQAYLGLRREYLNRGFSDEIVQAYYEYMVDIATLLGADRHRAKVDLMESLRFEMKLADISLPMEKRRNVTSLYNPMTIAELTQKFPTIPWLEYINRLIAPHATIGLEDVVIVVVPKYISDLELLLENAPKRVQANYVMWRVVGASVFYLTENLRRRQLSFVTAVLGQTERESRWKECVQITSSSLAIAVSALYVRNYFNENSKANVLEMVNDIRQQFSKTLSKVDWMDEYTRQAALEKADSMTTHIAYPAELLDIDKLTKLYEGLEMSSGKLMESVLNLTLFGTEYSISKLREPVNKKDWVAHGQVAIVDAFNRPTENSIHFPVGILQGGFFSAKRPAYLNYGAIGFVIAHEITHGFDYEGSQFDKNGNNVDWWQETTTQKFLEKAKCIIDQYSNYTVDEVGLKLNGVNGQSENIADNGGIKEAYYAYQAWTQRYGDEARLPGLEEYTPKQLFWLSHANTWCAVHRNEDIKTRITDGVHAPPRFRVVGPLSNMEEFADDFKCPAGSPMNPLNKCKVW